MKSLILLALLFNLPAFAGQKVNMADELLIEGEVEASTSFEADEELKAYQKELNNVKNLYQGFKAKKQVLKDLKSNAAKLTSEFKEYIDEKSTYEKEINEFNLEMKCLSTPNSPDCLKKNPLYKYGQQIKHIVLKHTPSLRECLTNKLTETITTHLTIGELGELKDIGWEHSKELKNPELLRCLGLVIQKINFPPTPTSEVVKIKQPINLKVN